MMAIWRRFLAAAPDAVLAATFVVVWLSPLSLGDRMVAHLMLVMLQEFIAIHSSAFAAAVLFGNKPRGPKVATLAGLGAFYSLFSVGFCLAFHQWWPLWALWAQFFNRMLRSLLTQPPPEEARQSAMAEVGAGTMFYIVFVFATTLLPVPQFGITASVVASLGLPGGGLWVEQPHRVIAFGFLYFAAQTAFQSGLVRFKPGTIRSETA